MSKNFDRADRLLKKQILSLNRHLPRRRKTLKELLGEERPHVLGADGTRHRFIKFELQKLAEILPESVHGRLKLPIYIEIESITSGARISGELETRIASEILNKESSAREIFIYKPEIKLLRSKLPSTTQYIFLVR
jgi:uncharacterized protein